MANKGAAYGDLAERQAKISSKYDAGLEKDLVAWMSTTIGETVPSGNFGETLKDGVVLAKLKNALGGKGKVYTGPMAFKQMENISGFLAWAPSFGVRPEYLFQTADLYEGSNLAGVQTCVDAVRRAAATVASGGAVENYEGRKAKPTKKGANPAHYSAKGKGELVNKSATSADDGRYGDMAERKAKLDAKYDPALEAELRTWIESKTGEKIGDDFQAGLKNGVILCKLANVLKPGSVKKVNNTSLAFKQMENINSFVSAAESLGVRGDSLFQTVCLYEGENMAQVLSTLDNLKRVTSSTG